MKPNELNDALKEARERKERRKQIAENANLPETIIQKAEAYDSMRDLIDEIYKKKLLLDAREKSLNEYEKQITEAFKELEKKTNDR